MPYAVLPDRAVLALSGPDAHDLLQGLVTNNIDPVAEGRAVYTALLTPQGKYLFDFFVVPCGNELLLDCQASRRDDLRKRLNMYRLRSQAEIADVSADVAVAVLFGETAPAALAPDDQAGAARELAGGTVYTDPRLAAAGLRAVLPTPAAVFAEHGVAAAEPADYDRHRLALALPDSEQDLVVDKSLLLESNFEELHGVDFSKGCFVGQEVTARTRYRGLVRKRLLPVRIAGPMPPAGTQVRLGGKDAGTMRSGRDGHGMALLRLEAVNMAQTGGGTLSADAAELTPLWPDWLPQPEPSDAG